ncbi:hypothetical protein NE237_012015 [Protea cynaroides]|uniref:Uncharacterized protein n=1 Tax=Protea cynaroides TaxID=273540 RepID=A0A9Q0JXL8_9MAGN|nr:hypothetical protein NE237_012015 [Protea cynaroides]
MILYLLLSPTYSPCPLLFRAPPSLALLGPATYKSWLFVCLGGILTTQVLQWVRLLLATGPHVFCWPPPYGLCQYPLNQPVSLLPLIIGNPNPIPSGSTLLPSPHTTLQSLLSNNCHPQLPSPHHSTARPSLPFPANQSPLLNPPTRAVLASSSGSLDKVDLSSLDEVDLDSLIPSFLGASCSSIPFAPLSDVETIHPALNHDGIQSLDDQYGKEYHHTPNRAEVLSEDNVALISSSSLVFLRSNRYRKPSDRLRDV